MRVGAASLPGFLFISVFTASIVLVGEGCSGDDTSFSNSTSHSGGSSGSAGGGLNTPGTLVSTCDTICSNVVAECTGASDLLGTCLSACNDLNLVNLGCLDPFASYLACVAGATSVQCGGDGQYVLITPSQCNADREAALSCNAQPGLIAACISVPTSNECGSVVATDGDSGIPTVVESPGQPYFCVGAPEGCFSPQTNPIGIGIYCCPGAIQ
jgi:hypothetical protein